MIKRLIKQLLPTSLRKKWEFYGTKRRLTDAYKYDLNRYMSYADMFGADTKQKLAGKIIRDYHVIEKGLTMPETRLGFGKARLTDLVDDCINFVNKYGKDDMQVMHALGVILEYEKFHVDNAYELEDVVKQAIAKIKGLKNIETSQIDTTSEEYFKEVESDFSQFSKSRSSIRNYAVKNVPLDQIREALEIAKSAPSACNRQCWRVYIFTDQEQIARILKLQGGNRGFGHLTNKLIVITSEIGVFSGIAERNQVFVDGGIYAMNVLYGLHYKKIVACILNCSNSVVKDKKMRALTGIKESEVFISMISCGLAPDEFKIATSERYPVDQSLTIV